MQFIEFNGLPGSGKTTLSVELLNELKKKGLKAYTYDEMHDKAPSSLMAQIVYVIKKWKFREVGQLLFASQDVKASSFVTQIKRVAIAEQICVNYRELTDSDGYCIVDQGIIQALTSVAYIYDMRNEDDFKRRCQAIIGEYRNNLLCVNCIASSKLAKERIRHRNFSDGSRFNFIKDDAVLEEMLCKQLITINRSQEYIREMGIKYIDVNMEKDITFNLGVIMREINQYES